MLVEFDSSSFNQSGITHNMPKEKANQKSKSRLENALESEERLASQREKIVDPVTDQNTDNSTTEKEPKEDIVDKILRGLIAAGAAVFTTAVIAGMLEASGHVEEIVFGSFFMIFMTLLLYLPFYKLFTWFGFFRQ